MTHYSNTSNPIDFPKLSVIDRLWGEALDRAVPDTYSSLSWTQVEKIKSVFAESIVRECLAQVARVDDMLEDEPAQKAAVAWVTSTIADHFGVDK